MEIPDRLIELLATAESVCVLTGAGISAESGVPTFREAQTGLWAKYDPERLATPQAFRQNPQLVWKWYEWRRSLVANAQPNPGHLALAEMEAILPDFTLITQNVDGLHQQAGSTRVIELHGNIIRNKCFQCGRQAKPDRPQDQDHIPPLCPYCQGLLRPDVVWFGESMPHEALSESIHAARTKEIFFTIGTSALVQPAASLPIEALNSNKITVEINPQTTPITPYMDFVINDFSGVVLPKLLARTWPGK